jgi:hypothetical protein
LASTIFILAALLEVAQAAPVLQAIDDKDLERVSPDEKSHHQV